EALSSISVPVLVVLLIVGTVAAFTDLRNFMVPNIVTIPLLAGGLVYHAVVSGGSGFAFALEGGLLGFSILILFYVLGGIAAGDVELLAAMGSWIGPSGVLALFIVSAVLGGVYALILTWRQGTLLQCILKTQVLLQQGMTIVKHLGSEERVEELVQRDDRRQ